MATDPPVDPANRRDQEQGVQARNQEFRRYEQVRKEQDYRLSESPTEEFDDEFVIQTCDMGDWWNGGDSGRQRFSAQLGRALEDIGFAILTGHGVDPQLYRTTEASTRRFFEEVPRESREPYLAQRHGSVNQGYFPVRATSRIHPDLVEGWVFCRRAFDLSEPSRFQERDFWPAGGFEPGFRKVCQAHEALILPIMQSILRYLEVDPHLYDSRLTGTNFGFRLNYYPAWKDVDAGAGGRMLGHEDVDLFTFLPAPSTEGLQVLNRRTLRWVRLQAPPGSIILNTGDYMQRITNDRLPSTTHRVSRPTEEATANQPRVSFPMAVYVWEDEMLEVLPGLGAPHYPPVSALQFHTKITSKYYGDDYAAG